MNKLWIGGAVLALGFVDAQAMTPTRTLSFKEERLRIEYNATLDEVALMVEADVEGADLAALEVRDPSGTPVMRLQGGHGATLALSSFAVESREMTFDEFRGEHPPGTYLMRGRATDGSSVLGTAVLSHALPVAASVEFPLEGAVGVPTEGLVIRWSAEGSAVGIDVLLEQGETDGLKIRLPAGAKSFEVPSHFLAPNTDTHVEIGTIGADGNRTIVERAFTTG
ncbi:MAG: hypothetical protein K8S98_09510 [Planctomycetes bacterium]|nr:hypothetical protein [Planctomycetota bacterium]